MSEIDDGLADQPLGSPPPNACSDGTLTPGGQHFPPPIGDDIEIDLADDE